MRSLTLLALTAIVALPLSAHDHWRDRRPVIMVEDSCRPDYRWAARGDEDRRWDDRWERSGYSRHQARRYDCDEDHFVLRPRPRRLAPPFEGRVVLRFH
jgi:hypothetical protein